MTSNFVTNHGAPIDVSAAIIVRGDDVLICRRAEGRHYANLWEFPGGKRENGESAEACLRREIAEELNVEIRVDRLFTRFEWRTAAHTLRFSFFFATIQSGAPVCLEHGAIRWVARQALPEFTFCPADVGVAARLANL